MLGETGSAESGGAVGNGMDNNFDIQKLCDRSLNALSVLDNECKSVGIELNSIDKLLASVPKTTIDPYNFIFSVIIGVVGGAVSQSSTLKSFLTNIHDGPGSAANSPVSSWLHESLGHAKDGLDKVGNDYLARIDGQKTYYKWHRLLRGHDPLSIRSDNPIYSLSSRYGVVGGCVRAVSHLALDTFSTQGLPVPGHSFFDFVDSNGSATNYLRSWSKKIGESGIIGSEMRGPGQEVGAKTFTNIFCVQGSDIIGSLATVAFMKAFFMLREITDEVECCQLRIISYLMTFLSSSMFSYLKNGVICVHIPSLGLLLYEIYRFLKVNLTDIQRLEKITQKLIAENIELERVVFANGSRLVSYASGSEYDNELKQTSDNFRKLSQIFDI